MALSTQPCRSISLTVSSSSSSRFDYPAKKANVFRTLINVNKAHASSSQQINASLSKPAALDPPPLYDDVDDDAHDYLEETDERVLSKRILELSRRNKFRSAFALYSSMKRLNLHPDPHACNSLVACLIRNGKQEHALNVFRFMNSKGILTGHTYSMVLKAVARSRGCDAAASAVPVPEKYLDPIVYNTMITMFGKENKWDQVEKIWRTMQENGDLGTAVTYRLLVCIFLRCDRNGLALDAYREMLRNGFSPCGDVLQAVIGACCREGNRDEAMTAFRRMLDNDMKPSLVTCNAVINLLSQSGEVGKAFKVFHLISALGYSPDSYSWNALLVALNRAGRPADALSLFDTIRKKHPGSVPSLHVYNTCLVSCRKLKLWQRAMQLLWETEAASGGASAKSYGLAIGACAAARRPEIALQVYRRMVRQHHRPDFFTLLMLIRACIRGSIWSEVQGIVDSASNEQLYNAAIQGTCLKKEMSLATKLYRKMCEIGFKPDGKTRALMEEHNLEKGSIF
ncbi:hypothetical protein M569_06172 [Genlisea aurea]|uniref:Pentacotripeptide-repeat region of PRORP domain-containing protein n=1 Tax=Genlisea aurea TaxID=192259 RepID=S8DZ40_9LAMI|nr:hypothetical protein M569_06172 [Genlisea aurea]